VGHAARIWIRGICEGFDVKARKKKPVARRRRRWDDNVKMDVRDWVVLTRLI
jgi:hypothetical protein